MLKLYTKDNCQPCNNVKAYLQSRPDLEVEVVNCTEQPERIFEFSDLSKTFPTLITDWGFVTNSEKILEHLATTNDDGSQKHTAYQNVKIDTFTEGYKAQPSPVQNIDNKITRIPEPDCEACQ